jgi:hypothetical protein
VGQERLPVSKIREVLRLKAEGFSDRQIAAAIGSARSTVQECARRARDAGVTWPLPPAMDEAALHATLYKRVVPRSRAPRPDFAYLHAALRRRGVTRLLANLRRSGRVVKNHVVTGRDPTADRAQESRVDSPHPDSTGTGDSIPPGIAMLIDILVREALRMVIAEQKGLPVCDSITEKTARSVKRNEPAIVSRRGYKDQTYFRLPVDCGAPDEGSARTRIRPGSTTEKCPAQSSRAIRTSAMTFPTPVGPSAGKRNRTIPQVAGNPERHASSPKSLSKVRSTRASSRLRASTS